MASEPHALPEYPYPVDRGSTHWEGCYRHRGHHNCAVVRADELAAQVYYLCRTGDGPCFCGRHARSYPGG